MNCQTVIAGVGGQGVLFAAKVFIELARARRLPVLGSQTFGMAQRGGSVMTHLKMGGFEGPLVCEGEADLLLGLDCVEAHRTLPYLHAARDGKRALCIVNAAPAQPFPDARIEALLDEMGIVVHTCDADAVALDMGRPLVANLVLLGYGSSRPEFPFRYDEVVDATHALSGPDHRSLNLEALERGHGL